MRRTKTDNTPASRVRFVIDELDGDYGRGILHGFDVHIPSGAFDFERLTVRALNEGGMIHLWADARTPPNEATLQVVRLES
ncbi:MAG: hypothetical protein ACRBN8_19125 [Nannocystales bacterium]